MKIIGISGIGIVGSAMVKSLLVNGYEMDKTLFVYDKYKFAAGDVDFIGNSKYINVFDDLLGTDILFLALPTQYNTNDKTYCLDPLIETLDLLEEKKYGGIIVIKSTVTPQTIDKFSNTYNLSIVHNPEFLTARTGFEDFHNQKHIVLGKAINCDENKFDWVVDFYRTNYPKSEISICKAIESESMKLFLNNFYAIKIQFFTEIYLLCDKLGVEYDNVKNLMLKNGWINPMHTKIPGPDGNISYGGLCFSKDTNALNHFMQMCETPHSILDATITERNIMRGQEQQNIIL